MTTPDRKVFLEVTEAIAQWRRPLLITHAKPDGDALGSLAAMRSFLKGRGADPMALLFDAIPDCYALFRRYNPMPVWGDSVRDGDLAGIDGVIMLDTCTYSQLEPIADWLRATDVPKLAVDHHVTREDLADHYLIDESAAATCLILHAWAQALDWEIPHDTAEAMFVGIAMDTGWFKHSNTDARVLAAAADLLSRGVGANELHEQLFHRETPARVRLLGVALGSLELLANNRLAVMMLSSEALQKAGATPADTEDIVNEPLRIGSVVVSVLLVEQEKELIRASFRSKAPKETDPSIPDIDVARIAQKFNGGGHKRAAGARVAGRIDEVCTRIAQHLESVLP